MGLLERVDSPEDLKRLTTAELTVLAGEIRELITETVFKTGGHLASNLGVVELTIALHYVFDFHRDALIFDVSHQSYTHKILTGRREAFVEGLRRRGGLSGFTNPEESPADVFVCGHAGTAFSAALGMAAGDRLAGRDRNVVALVGDGALGTGMTLEALNHAAELHPRLLVVLNDNRMSISPTVGAFGKHLSRIRTAPLYRDAKRTIRRVARRLATVVGQMERTAERAFGFLRRLLLPPGFLFEELGFSYYGPVDGHDIPLLVDLLRRVRNGADGPVILHAVTTKGRGHAPAEADPERFHGAPPAVGRDGKVRTTTITTAPSYTSAFSAALHDFFLKHQDAVAITAGMPTGTGLDVIRRRFPERFFDVGICEQHALGLAAGLAKSGLFPIIAIYSTFLQRAYDQLFHEIALNRVPCVIAADRAGVVGRDGPTHHGTFDTAYARALPGLTLAAPARGAEIPAFLETAHARRLSLVLRYPRDRVPDPDAPVLDGTFEVGRAETLREGRDAALLGYGATVSICLAAADLLARRGIETGVVNLRWAKPLDAEAVVRCARRHRRLFVADDHTIVGGVGGAVAEALAGTPHARKLKVIALPDAFVGHGSRAELLASFGLDPESVAEAVASVVTPLPRRGSRQR